MDFISGMSGKRYKRVWNTGATVSVCVVIPTGSDPGSHCVVWYYMVIPPSLN